MRTNWQSLIHQFSHDCDWVSIREYKETTDSISARNGKPEGSSSKISHGVMLEVMVEGQFAYAGTVDMSDQGLQKAFEKAKHMAMISSPHKLHAFDLDTRPAHSGKYQTSTQMQLDTLSFGEIQRKLINISKQAETSNEIIDTWAQAMLIRTDIYYLSSNGSEWNQNFSIVSKDFGVTAKRDNETQSRSYGFNGLQIGLEDLDDNILEVEAIRIGNQAVELLGARDCPADTRDLMLVPDQLYLQIHESIGHPLELDRILGDERNYAGWSFISPDDFGNLQYGSHKMNVSFNPETETGMASYAFDDSGVPAEKAYLIKDGVLLRGIGGIESQQRSGLPGVASSRSSDWNRPPIDRMANINLEPGDSSMADMISNTEKGILMETNRSWSIDDYRNKFQFGCEYARLIEDGKITETVKNPNYRGVTTPFWNNLKFVGNQETAQVYGSPYCGKGEPNQVIRVGHSTPTCVFSDIEIFGGA